MVPYPAQYESDVVLRDGSTLRLRPVRPDDGEGLRALYDIPANLSVLVVPESWKPPTPEAPDLAGTGPIIAGIDMTCPSIEGAE